MEDPLRGRIVLTNSPAAEHTGPEVLVQLVLATVFKTVGPHGNHVAGGFDSHALPPECLAWPRVCSHTTPRIPLFPVGNRARP